MSGPGRRRRVSDEDILEVFRQSADPVLTTKEVAAGLDIGHRGTFDRLRELEDEDILRMKKVGESGAVWWLPNYRNSESRK